MNDHPITIFYENRLVILLLSGIFNIILFLFRNRICLFLMRSIVVAQALRQIRIFRLEIDQNPPHAGHPKISFFTISIVFFRI